MKIPVKGKERKTQGKGNKTRKGKWKIRRKGKKTVIYCELHITEERLRKKLSQVKYEHHNSQKFLRHFRQHVNKQNNMLKITIKNM